MSLIRLLFTHLRLLRGQYQRKQQEMCYSRTGRGPEVQHRNRLMLWCVLEKFTKMEHGSELTLEEVPLLLFSTCCGGTISTFVAIPRQTLPPASGTLLSTIQNRISKKSARSAPMMQTRHRGGPRTRTLGRHQSRSGVRYYHRDELSAPDLSAQRTLNTDRRLGARVTRYPARCPLLDSSSPAQLRTRP